MWKEGWEKMTLTEQTEVKRDRGRQRITYPASLSELMTEQGFGEIAKTTTFIKTYKGQEIVESHDR